MKEEKKDYVIEDESDDEGCWIGIAIIALMALLVFHQWVL